MLVNKLPLLYKSNAGKEKYQSLHKWACFNSPIKSSIIIIGLNVVWQTSLYMYKAKTLNIVLGLEDLTLNETYVSSMGGVGGGGVAGLGGSTFSSISSLGFRVRWISFFSFLTIPLLRFSSSSASLRALWSSASLSESSFGVKGSGDGGGCTGDWRPSLSLGRVMGSVFCIKKEMHAY